MFIYLLSLCWVIALHSAALPEVSEEESKSASSVVQEEKEEEKPLRCWVIVGTESDIKKKLKAASTQGVTFESLKAYLEDDASLEHKECEAKLTTSLTNYLQSKGLLNKGSIPKNAGIPHEQS